MEVIDRRKLKAEAEAAAPAPEVQAVVAEIREKLEAAVKEPTALDIVKDRAHRQTEALLNGDMEAANAIDDECSNPKRTYGDVVPFKKTVLGEVQSWKSVGFVVAFLPMGQAQVLMVRAVGMRSDERLFTADYAMPPVWEEGDDFTAEAMKRLNTFKACCCDDHGRCKFHGEALPGQKGAGKWLEADMKRLQSIQGAQLPEAVEALMKIETERMNNRIVVPGRP